MAVSGRQTTTSNMKDLASEHDLDHPDTSHQLSWQAAPDERLARMQAREHCIGGQDGAHAHIEDLSLF